MMLIKIRSITLSLLIITFLLGHFYAVPSVEGSFGYIKYIRYFILLATFIFMSFQLATRGGNLFKNTKFFFVAMLVWILSISISVINHPETIWDAYYRLVQAAYIFVIVLYFMDNEILQELFNIVNRLRPFLWIGSICLVIFSLKNTIFMEGHKFGFGSSRVGYSIFISQLICLILWSSVYQINSQEKISNREDSVFLALFISAILMALIIFSGGRLGLLLTSIYLIGYMRIINLGWQKIVFFVVNMIAFLWIIKIVTVALMPVISEYSLIREDILRVHAYSVWEDSADNMGYFQSILHFIDIYSSYRISILIHSLQAISFETFLYGKGVHQFYVEANIRGELYAPHVAFINYLGEMGICGLVGFMMIILNSFYRLRLRSRMFGFEALPIITSPIIFFLQPASMLTAVTSSLIYFIAYAVLMNCDSNDGR